MVECNACKTELLVSQIIAASHKRSENANHKVRTHWKAYETFLCGQNLGSCLDHNGV
jgi:hypothetical protein